jgi:hypothetical protein
VKGFLGCVRATVEAYLLENITRVPDDSDVSQSFRLLRTAGILPSPRQQDLLRIALDRALLQEFNPFLSQASYDRLYGTVVNWMELCVLEDRLARLGQLAASPSDTLRDIVEVWQCFHMLSRNLYHGFVKKSTFYLSLKLGLSLRDVFWITLSCSKYKKSAGNCTNGDGRKLQAMDSADFQSH